MELREDNSGFINFPIANSIFSRLEGKTIIYLVAFELSDISNNPYILSNIRINLPGNFLTDDIQSSNDIRFFNESGLSIPMTSCICLGWSDQTFISKENDRQWYASFADLSSEGRKLYYTIKKLHNNKEVRILTFNQI